MKKIKLLLLLSILTFQTMPICWAKIANGVIYEVLPAPSNVAATDVEPNAVYITWEYPHDMTYIFFEVYRSTTPYGTFSKIGITGDLYWIDTDAWPTIKPPQNVSASTTSADGILLSWSDPVFLPKVYYYKIKAQESGGENRTSAYSQMDPGSMLDYLDSQSARIYVADNALGPYTLLAENQPSPETGTSTYWHNPLSFAIYKYYRVTVSMLYCHKPSNQSEITEGSTIPTLTGPTTLCTIEYPYTINILPAGSSLTWQASSNIAMVSEQGTNPCYFKGYTYGSGWIEATIWLTGGGSYTLPRQTVQVNPMLGYHSIDYFLDCNSVTLTAEVSGTDLTWHASSNLLLNGNTSPYSTNSNSVTLSTSDGLGGTGYVMTNIGCKTEDFTFCPCQSWSPTATWIWGNPMPGEPLQVEVSPLLPEAYKYQWYIGSQLIETTYDGYLNTYNWPCVYDMLRVIAITPCGASIAIEVGDFWGLCGNRLMSSNVNVYPNPASSQVTVGLEETPALDKNVKNGNSRIVLSEITRISIIDMMGSTRKIYKFGKGNMNVVINLPYLSPSTYHLEISDGVKSVRKPLTIKR